MGGGQVALVGQVNCGQAYPQHLGVVSGGSRDFIWRLASLEKRHG